MVFLFRLSDTSKPVLKAPKFLLAGRLGYVRRRD
jgi:hypothetical protein